MKRTWFAVAVAAVLWFVMFSPWTAPRVDFWQMMAGSALVLTALVTLFTPPWWERLRLDGRNLVLGVVVAVVLWGVFWVGDKVASWMFTFARPQVDTIYGIKEGMSPWLLSALLLFLIGPAEEIFWRGYVQENFSRRWGGNVGFLVATACYTLVHVPSLNFMLVMASLVCGAAWGLLYRLIPQHFTAIVISHALWDAAVFVWFPIM
ncbi:MAG: CPBP family intramembrane metalloprotease [Alistipes sp.]|nr:CPBP family intramembrane metalloprotease [Alistipes sp.]